MPNITEIQGFAEFERQLKRLPEKQKRSEILKVLRKVTRPLIQAARANINDHTGNLSRSIGNITGKSREYPNILVGPRAKGKNRGQHGHLVEAGHGGPKAAPAHPYMKPAIDQTSNLISKDMEQKIAKHLQKTIDRLSK